MRSSEYQDDREYNRTLVRGEDCSLYLRGEKTQEWRRCGSGWQRHAATLLCIQQMDFLPGDEVSTTRKYCNLLMTLRARYGLDDSHSAATKSYHPVELQYLHISYPKRYTNTHARSYPTVYQPVTSPSEILYRRKEARLEFGHL